MAIDGGPVKGRGAGIQPPNRFLRMHHAVVHPEGIDEPEVGDRSTTYLEVHPRSILNRVESSDLPFRWSLNPYQGCEHGCSYCYARPTHEYWGYSAGQDFERVVLLKRNAPALLEEAFRSPRWVVDPVMIAGATDPYQPVERAERITRGLLEVFHAYKHPVGLITKNALVLRDLDLLAELAQQRLVTVAISLTTLDKDLRRCLEPRTSTASDRLRAIEGLAAAGVPVHVMVAPIIPGLNDHEVPALLKAAADAGARSAGYTILRTNGPVEPVFRQWLHDHRPERAAKVIAQVSAVHGGAMHDTRPGVRMRGEGPFAENIRRVFQLMRRRYFAGRTMPAPDTTLFTRPPRGQLDLFA